MKKSDSSKVIVPVEVEGSESDSDSDDFHTPFHKTTMGAKSNPSVMVETLQDSKEEEDVEDEEYTEDMNKAPRQAQPAKVPSRVTTQLPTELKTWILKLNKKLQRWDVILNIQHGVDFINHLRSLEPEMKAWEQKLVAYKEEQHNLERQGSNFPDQWVPVDTVVREWRAFCDIIKHKEDFEHVNMTEAIVIEDQEVEARTSIYLSEWKEAGLVLGNAKPGEQVHLLEAFQTKHSQLEEERDSIVKAKKAFVVRDSGPVSTIKERMQEVLHDFVRFKNWWLVLGRIWKKIDEMREERWLATQPPVVLLKINKLLGQMKKLIASQQQYGSFKKAQKMLVEYRNTNILITELKSDALKQRHWDTLGSKRRVNWKLSDLTLGQVWDVDLLRNKALVRGVILVAQKEMALQLTLGSIREAWETYELDLTNCPVVKGLDGVFNKVMEHVNSLAAMKFSPYSKVFEEEAAILEGQLNCIRALFNVIIIVQHRWEYLEKASRSSTPETIVFFRTSRYQRYSSKFLVVMEEVSKSPKVVDVLKIAGVQRDLEDLAISFRKILHNLMKIE